MAQADVATHMRTFQLTVSERDDLGLVRYQYDGPLWTMTASWSGRMWIGGEGAQGGFYLSTGLHALMMGMDRLSGNFRRAERLMNQSQLREAVGCSIQLAWGAALMAAADSRVVGGLGDTYGSLWSGSIDMGYEATKQIVRARHPERSLEQVFAAESGSLQREVLQARHPREVHSTAEAAALVAPRCSTLFASAPCWLVSTAGSSGDWGQKQLDASMCSWDASETIQEYVCRNMPDVVASEQSSGMQTHHPKAHDAFNGGLLQLPYACFQTLTDATSLGAAEHRLRMGWVLVRLDRLTAPVEDAALGAWWLKEGGCPTCGAGLAAGRCVRMACAAGASWALATTSPPAMDALVLPHASLVPCSL